MESKNIMLIFVTLALFNNSFSRVDFYSSTKCPAMFIYNSIENEKRLGDKKDIKDSFGNIASQITDPENVYLAPSIGCDGLVLDPRNPENIFVYQRTKPENTISLPGGFVGNLLPINGTILRFNEKFKTSDDSPIVYYQGKLGFPALEQMDMNTRSREGPFVGVFGNPDRTSSGHTVSVAYNLIISEDAASKFVPRNTDKVVAVLSCKIIDLLRANMEFFIPENKRSSHFLSSVPAPSGPCSLPLHEDHCLILYKFYALLVNKGLLQKETGNKTEEADSLASYYRFINTSAEDMRLI